MTDKQIIIHGVDVSGCEFYSNNGWCCCALIYDDYCKDFNKCIYKLEQQLIHKEQECERLKEIANNALDKVNNYLDKKEKSLLYKQTLTEIKEIGETCSFTDNSELLLSRIEHILEKINECEVE